MRIAVQQSHNFVYYIRTFAFDYKNFFKSNVEKVPLKEKNSLTTINHGRLTPRAFGTYQLAIVGILIHIAM